MPTDNLNTIDIQGRDPMAPSDETYMRRALQLSLLGEGAVSPNPMVGAVIVAPGGRIIGEGYHRRYGGPHAEVNAVASVRETDRELLSQSTMYVTLEPCSHYGKTPPCAKLILECGIPRVVVGTLDPFPKVSGRGVEMLRRGGVEVRTGVLAKECEAVNRRFMTAHRLGRPWVILKWAESSDGYIGARDKNGAPGPVALSDAMGLVWMHRERSQCDAILVGTDTIVADNPSLTLRRWPGKSPRPVTFRSARIPADAAIMRRDPLWIQPHAPLLPQLQRLYNEHGITSLMVEGGAKTLESFINEGLVDEIRCEKTAVALGCGVMAPDVRGHRLRSDV